MAALIFSHSIVTVDGGAAAWIGDHGNRGELDEVLRSQGGEPYARFLPQFGLGSDQFVVMTSGGTVPSAGLAALPDVAATETRALHATSRPTSTTPPRRPGAYVHRWFDLPSEHVDEAVRLSTEAWTTYEATFDVEVVGFFRTVPDPADGGAELMLLNWYPSLAGWEASRNFDADPESFRRFARRQQLSTRTRAIATTLVS